MAGCVDQVGNLTPGAHFSGSSWQIQNAQGHAMQMQCNWFASRRKDKVTGYFVGNTTMYIYIYICIYAYL